MFNYTQSYTKIKCFFCIFLFFIQIDTIIKGEVTMTVYERIQKLSKEHGLSVRELGRKLDIGETTIYKWKTQTPKLDVLEKVADYFDVSVDYLVGRTETKSTQSNDLISIEKPEIRSLARRMNDFDDDDIKFISNILDRIGKKHDMK